MFSFQLLLKVIYTRPNTDTNWYFCNTEQLTNPWMILGFDSKPDWWEDCYGTDYSSDNKCWSDIENGIIKDGSQQGQYEHLKKTFITHMVKESEMVKQYENQGKIIEYLVQGFDTEEFIVETKFDSITTYEEFIKQLEDPSNQEFLDAMDEYNKNHNITVELEEFLLDND